MTSNIPDTVSDPRNISILLGPFRPRQPCRHRRHAPLKPQPTFISPFTPSDGAPRRLPINHVPGCCRTAAFHAPSFPAGAKFRPLSQSEPTPRPRLWKMIKTGLRPAMFVKCSLESTPSPTNRFAASRRRSISKAVQPCYLEAGLSFYFQQCSRCCLGDLENLEEGWG